MSSRFAQAMPHAGLSNWATNINKAISFVACPRAAVGGSAPTPGGEALAPEAMRR